MLNEERTLEFGFSRRLLFRMVFGAMALPSLTAVSEAISVSGGYNFIVQNRQVNDTTLWFDRPADTWTEALPVGNGRLGAMHFGGVEDEHLQLNEGTLWAGGPQDYDHAGAADSITEIRKLIFEGKYQEATSLADKNVMSQPLGQAPYQTVGDLHLKFGHVDFQNYRRSLNLDSAVSVVSYLSGGVRYKRELIASHPDNVIALHLSADKPGSISFEASLSSPQKSTVKADGRSLRLDGVGPDFDGIPGVVRFVSLFEIDAKGGAVTVEGDSVRVSAADSVTIVVAIATSYKNYEDVSGDPLSLVQSAVSSLRNTGFDRLRNRHVRDHQALFRRVSIDLGGLAEDLPTDRRISEFAAGRDTRLPALYFQYGRYLLIACSRAGGQAATLQGLWNNSTTPPWGSKYTININTEMNYWPAEKAALSECHEPLFELIGDIAQTGRKTAKVHYGVGGWVTHHNTDGWRGAAPIDGASWGLWPMGGAWLCTHLWEHYLYSGNRKKLERHFEWIKGSTDFFMQTLVDLPGTNYIVTNPSTSPENQHPHGSGLCAGATMDLQILRDLFGIFVAASEIIGDDPNFRQLVASARANLAPMKVGHAGQLQEWLEDWDVEAPEIHHRHVSHLYGLFPSSQISPEKTPALANAAKRTLEIRGDEGTGWSLAWKINFWARLHDGNHAYRLIRDALRLEGHGGGGVYPNLFDAHPPFQIDGNFGFTSGVIEMLLQSHDGVIQLLPALPDAWSTGEIKGLKARGGLTVDLTWSGGALVHATVRAARVIQTEVRYAGKSVEISLQAGEHRVFDGALV